MNITINHTKNPAVGWNVDVTALGEAASEKISQVIVKINGFPEPTETLNPPVKSWHKLYTQKGQYPGDNKVEVTASDQDGNQTSATDVWE